MATRESIPFVYFQTKKTNIFSPLNADLHKMEFPINFLHLENENQKRENVK